ncbi:MAG TPA: glycoside hydrolase family 28 protein [Opitutaceae bacterium]|nr:glycoside hydrolase family 28 protein [Opitutaceae bacterium]
MPFPPMRRFLCVLALFSSLAVVRGAPPKPELPSWVGEVGAKRIPQGAKEYAVKAFGAVADGRTVATAAIQRAIDTASAAGGGVVTFEPGTYLTGALFVKSHVHLRIDRGVTLMGVADLAAYPRRPTRVAGIEMEWPSALLNVYDAEDVEISGGGTVDGNGEWCWRKYQTMRPEYERLGLRWAVDYDAERVRLFVAWKSHDVTLQGLHLRRAGFWTVQVTYCDHVTVDGIRITDNAGPSTDGVDIDSSSYVLVEHCDIDNNDDDICLKSGRDADGQRVNRPTEYVVIRENTTRRGGGIVSFGSETAGGIRHIVAYRNKGIGTSEGLRFKSARTRGGYIHDVLVLDTTMEHVPRPFSFNLDWNPAYSYVTLPKDPAKLPPELHGRMPAYWKVMAEPVPLSRGLADFGDITIAGVDASGATQIFTASGVASRPLHDIAWTNVVARGRRAGRIDYARNWTMTNVKVLTPDGEPVQILNAENVQAPDVEKAPVEKAPATTR